MYEKAVEALKAHCQQCPVGMALHLLEDSFARVDAEQKASEPTKPKESRAKPVKREKTSPNPNRTEKACNKCRMVKPLLEFTANKECIDGHVGTCRACVRERVRKHKGQASTPPAKSEKPHACTVCGVRFHSIDTLTEHQKIRHGA